jgi:hypothetical protein
VLQIRERQIEKAEFERNEIAVVERSESKSVVQYSDSEKDVRPGFSAALTHRLAAAGRSAHAASNLSRAVRRPHTQASDRRGF